VPFASDEGVADLAADLGADRDVLQVRVVRRQPPSLRSGQAEAGVDPSGLGIDLLLKRVGVGALELAQLAPFEDEGRAFDAFRGKPLELVDVGRILAALALAPALEAQAAVQHFAELLRASDRERTARRLVHALLEPGDLLAELAAQPGEILPVDLDPAPLHPADHRDQRLVDPLVDPSHSRSVMSASSPAYSVAGPSGTLSKVIWLFPVPHSDL